MTLPTNTTSLLTYFPALAGLGVIAAFWAQSKAFFLKIFRIFWKNRVINYEFQEPFYKTLFKKSWVFNFDDFDLWPQDLFSIKDKQYLPVFIKAYHNEIFFYKGFIPIFLFGNKNGELKIQYLKWTFDFEKFLSKVTHEVHENRKNLYLEKQKQVEQINNFYIEEIRGKSLKSRSIEESNSKGNPTPSDAPPLVASETFYTLSPQQTFRQNFNRIIGFNNQSFSWDVPITNLKNKYQFTKQGHYILEQVHKWLKSAKWCEERNIPHRRGALIYGSAGNGKSSLILETAKTLKIPIFYFDISEMNNEEFSKAIDKLPTYPAILLFEDFDCQFNKRESLSKTTQCQNITFDYFINKISGVKSIKSKFIFITTNDITKIDDSLLRSGRLDYKIKLEGLNMEEKLAMATVTLDNNQKLIEESMKDAEPLTTSEFENRIIQIALNNYWENEKL